MGIKTHTPTSPGRRFRVDLSNEELTQSNKPEKRLTKGYQGATGRGFKGQVTMRHRGGGVKRKYRQIDFKRDKLGILGKVVSIEYDPNRSANIAKVAYQDGEKRYILAPLGLAMGDHIESGEEAAINVGNALPLNRIPVGTVVHNVELTPGRGAQIARSAGQSASVMAKEGGFALLKMPSGEQRQVSVSCYATVGQVGNLDVSNIKLGKAGRARQKGVRPHVRGVAMDPSSHPHGGGEGKVGTGRPPKTRWGKRAAGKTRKNKRSNRYIVRRRNGK